MTEPEYLTILKRIYDLLLSGQSELAAVQLYKEIEKVEKATKEKAVKPPAENPAYTTQS